MDIKKLAPWNWFKKEDEETGSVVPVQISGHLVLHRGLGLGGDIADQFQQPADPLPMLGRQSGQIIFNRHQPPNLKDGPAGRVVHSLYFCNLFCRVLRVIPRRLAASLLLPSVSLRVCLISTFSASCSVAGLAVPACGFS